MAERDLNESLLEDSVKGIDEVLELIRKNIQEEKAGEGHTVIKIKNLGVVVGYTCPKAPGKTVFLGHPYEETGMADIGGVTGAHHMPVEEFVCGYCNCKPKLSIEEMKEYLDDE
jgi:hypothetical protein